MFCLRNRVAIFRSATAPDSGSDDEDGAVPPEPGDENLTWNRLWNLLKIMDVDSEAFSVSFSDDLPGRAGEALISEFLRQDTSYLSFTFRLTLTMATANLRTSPPPPMDLGEMASGKSNSSVIPLESTSSFGMVACNV